MKTLKSLFVFTMVSTFLIGCGPQPLEGDEEPPQIEVILPNNNAHFYTTSSETSPSTVVANAIATDNNAIKLGTVTITDTNGKVVHATAETNFHKNNTTPEVYTSFSTNTPGVYTVTFVFTDPNDNSATVSRTIEFFKINPDGDGDEAAKSQTIN